MAKILRGSFLTGLTKLQKEGRPSFAWPASVLACLGNYTHQVAISERRNQRFEE
jgi:hypothetical protein